MIDAFNVTGFRVHKIPTPLGVVVEFIAEDSRGQRSGQRLFLPAERAEELAQDIATALQQLRATGASP